MAANRSLTLALLLSSLVFVGNSTAFAHDDEDPSNAPVTLPGNGGPEKRHANERIPVESEEVHQPTAFAPDRFPLAGYHGGRFYIRDSRDVFRLYPGLLLQVDGLTSFGEGVGQIQGAAAESTRSRIVAQRARAELGGEILQAWRFYLTYDAAPSKSRLEHALIDMKFHRLLHLSVGQQQVPFTMENRTSDAATAWMERPLAVRFAVPQSKDTGVMLWGSTPNHLLAYEAGVFGGDGQNRSSPDNRADLMGRVYVRPLANSHGFVNEIQIGFSGHWGVRDARSVGYSVDPLVTHGGWTFWQPTYQDALGRTIKVIPSGTQTAFAGEMRVPVSRLDFRFEFTAVSRETREAVSGQELSTTERLGDLKGYAYYAQLGFWVIGEPSMVEDPGMFRPPHIRFPKGHPHSPPRGLEVLLRFEQLSAQYRSEGRCGAADGCASNSPGTVDIKANVFGAGVKYHATSHAGVYLNYTLTHLPDSTTATTLATVTPGNATNNSVHTFHELGTRFQVAF